MTKKTVYKLVELMLNPYLPVTMTVFVVKVVRFRSKRIPNWRKSKVPSLRWSEIKLTFSEIFLVLFKSLLSNSATTIAEGKIPLSSISSKLYVRIFCTKFWRQKLQSWNLTRESCTIFLYEKGVHNLLMKLTPGRHTKWCQSPEKLLCRVNFEKFIKRISILIIKLPNL